MDLFIDETKKPKTSSFINEVRNLSRYAWAIIVVVFGVWFMITPYRNMVIAMYFASAFYVIETAFCTVTDGGMQAIVMSTPEQFIVNILFVSILLPAFNCPLMSLPHWQRAMLTTVFIWLLEIVEGYFLIFLFGYNRAWKYYGKDALFNGTIKLSYVPLWILLGFGYFYFVGDMIDSMQNVLF